MLNAVEWPWVACHLLSLSTQPSPLLSGARKGLKGSEVNLRPFRDLNASAASSYLSSPFNQETKDEPEIFPHCNEIAQRRNENHKSI